MNSTDVTTTLSWLVLLIALAVAGFLAVLMLAFAQPQRSARIAQVLVQSCLVAVVVVVVLKFSWRVPESRVGLPNKSFIDAASARILESPILPRVLDQPAAELESLQSEKQVPEWTRHPVRVDGGRKLIVVSSGRFASKEEAELHGIQQAAATAVKEYLSLDPRGVGAVQPQHADVVTHTAIKQRFLEIAQHDFGKFQAPMYQLWLQVELTPELGERMAEPWRKAAVDARLRMLTGWSLWGTAAAALAAFALRLDSAWNGRRRAVVAGTAIVLTLGSLAFLA